ncbi:hypothetical protein [uncultured Campylobacter sp.]|nr:hypothetical protein [uncultured Campylobacter sp.]
MAYLKILIYTEILRGYKQLGIGVNLPRLSKITVNLGRSLAKFNE